MEEIDRYLCFIAEVTAEYKGELRKYRQTSILKSSYATKNPKKFALILLPQKIKIHRRQKDILLLKS